MYKCVCVCTTNVCFANAGFVWCKWLWWTSQNICFLCAASSTELTGFKEENLQSHQKMNGTWYNESPPSISKHTKAYQNMANKCPWQAVQSFHMACHSQPQPATAAKKDSLRRLRLKPGRHLRPTFHFVGIDFHEGTILVDATEVEQWSEFFLDVLWGV